MLELYLARLAHIEELSSTSLLYDMESSIVKKTAATLKKVLKIQEQDIKSGDVSNRIIQSSRNLYIGNQETPISNEDKSSLSDFLLALISGDQLGEFNVTGTETNSMGTSVSIKHRDVEFDFNFSLPYDSQDNFNNINYELSVSKIDVEPFVDGWVTRNRTLMIKCRLGHYWSVGDAVMYLKCINEQGLRVDGSRWFGHVFSEHESLQIIFELVLNNDFSVDEDDLIDLRIYTDDCIHYTSFNEIPPTFDTAIRCLSNLTGYLTSIYDYNKYAFDFGETIALGFLIATLNMSENDEHFTRIANTLIDGMNDYLDLEEIKPTISKHFQQLDNGEDIFEYMEDLEDKLEKLYTNIDECAAEAEEWQF